MIAESKLLADTCEKILFPTPETASMYNDQIAAVYRVEIKQWYINSSIIKLMNVDAAIWEMAAADQYDGIISRIKIKNYYACIEWCLLAIA